MIDLHIHTNHSDGTDSVSEMLEKAEKARLNTISITDHDSIDAYLELEKNPEIRIKFSGQIIVGAELKTYYKKISIEVLAYGIDHKKIDIYKIDRESVQKKILEYYRKIMDEHGFKYDANELYIDLSDTQKQWASFIVAGEILKHPENKKLIEEIGEFTQTTFFRIHQCNPDSIFYSDETQYSIEINEVIKRIHDAGGLAFLAHGWIYPYKDKKNILEEIAQNTEIDGFECIYPLFSEEESNFLMDLCKKYNKYISGGSDYHAKNKPNINLGTGINNNILVNDELIVPWIDKVKKI